MDNKPASLGSGSIHRLPRGLLHPLPWEANPQSGRKDCYQSLAGIPEAGIKIAGKIPLLGSCSVEVKMSQKEVLLLRYACGRSQDDHHKE